MPIYHQITQRSREWFLKRLGIPTASEFHKILTPGGKISAQATGYAHVLLAELMLGKALDAYEGEWMTRGSELEGAAISAYEFEGGVETQPGGFVTNDAGTYGCSPDRLVGEDGVLEIKCPAPNTHVGYLLARSAEKEKYPQIQGQLLVTGRKWIDLMSYHPELPPVILRIERDEEYIASLAKVLDTFCEQLQALRAQLEERYGKFPEIVLPAADDCGEFGVSEDDAAAIWAASQATK